MPCVRDRVLPFGDCVLPLHGRAYLAAAIERHRSAMIERYRAATVRERYTINSRDVSDYVLVLWI
jgi:hypothetical protein